MPQHVRKNDIVIITAGKEKGKQGKVAKVLPKENKVIVEGLNLVKKHLKPGGNRQQGSIIQKEAPIHMSNVSPVVDGKAVRVRFKTQADGSKIRVAANKAGTQIGEALVKAR